MVGRVLRAAAVPLIAVASLGMRFKLTKSSTKPRADIIRAPRVAATGMSDEAFYKMLGSNISIRRPFFQTWSTDVAWYVPFDGLPFTPVLNCEPGESVLMSRFDWQIVPESSFGKFDKNTSGKNRACGPVTSLPWKNSTMSADDPRTIWAVPHAVPRLLDFANKHLSALHAERAVVFLGTELPLSIAFGRSHAERVATVARLRRFFGRILYQTMDIELDNVNVAPMGLCWGYIMHLLTPQEQYLRSRREIAQKIMDIDTILRYNLSFKTKDILGPGIFAASWLEVPDIQFKISLYRRKGLLFPPADSSLRAVSAASTSRGLMRAWANTSAARAAGVELQQLPLDEWWHELAKYRFLLSPMGSAIQTSKTIEALLVLTVPIVQRMGFVTHDELVKLGFPIVVIEHWAEISLASCKLWWQALASRLESFRRNCLSVDGYWRIYTGQVSHCT